MSFPHLVQNVDSKAMREQRLDMQRRAAEAGDDDLIPFGDRPTVSRFGAISRTSKAMYQNSGPMQAMAVQGAATKSIISGMICALGFCCLLLFPLLLQCLQVEDKPCKLVSCLRNTAMVCVNAT